MENKIILKYEDDCHNMATIEEIECLAYYGAKYKQKAFVLKLYATYDDNMLYHLTMHETLNDATDKLKTFSLGTFKLITEGGRINVYT